MKLLFNKSDNGSDELKELLGYVDGDLKFANLRADVLSSTNDVISLIGKEVYRKAVEAYHNPADSASEDLLLLYDDFIRVVRYPIAVNGYRLYAPTNDIAHTENGRKMRQDDGEKQAFEWMIERDNVSQEKRFYRGLDDLIKFLDALEEIVAAEPAEGEEVIPLPDSAIFQNELRSAWLASNAFKQSRVCFVRSVEEFGEFFPIDSRLVLVRLAPALQECEKYEVRRRIPAVKFAELKAKLESEQDPDFSGSDAELVRLIKKACVFYAMAWAMKRFSVNLLPDGVVQRYTSDRTTIKGSRPSLNIEPYAAELAFRGDCDAALAEIEALVAPVVAPEKVEPIKPSGSADDKYFTI